MHLDSERRVPFRAGGEQKEEKGGIGNVIAANDKPSGGSVASDFQSALNPECD